MTDNNTDENPDKDLETDMLADGHLAAIVADEDQQKADLATENTEPALLAEEDLRNIMAQFTPMALKDIDVIQKGVENFFLFHQEPHALAGPQSMEHLGDTELNILEERNTFVRYHYIELDKESGKLKIIPALIRPASLKNEQIARVKEACVRTSVESFLNYVARRDQNSQELEKEDRLGSWVSSRFLQSTESKISELDINNRTDLVHLMAKLRNLSVEYFLEQDCRIDEGLLVPMISLMNRTARELLSHLNSFKDQNEIVTAVLANRGELPFLIELTGDFHLIQPPGSMLIEIRNEKIIENRSELEWVMELYQQIAWHILRIILPEEQHTALVTNDKKKAHQFYTELQKHPSFYQSNDWEGGAAFLQSYNRLLTQVEIIQTVRKEYLIRQVMQENLNSLNMRFEPLLFQIDEFDTIDPAALEYLTKEELFEEVVTRMQSLDDVFSMPERRKKQGKPNIYFIYKSNIPRAFASLSGRRNFLHLFCKHNSQTNGIYDSLIDVSNPAIPDDIVEDQITLGKAIREWEAELEKEQRKSKLARMGFWGRFIYFIKSLFGMQPDLSRRDEDLAEDSNTPNNSKSSDSGARSKRKRNSSKDNRPKEKIIAIPQKVQQAIDFVERNHHGLIWVDEIMYALNSVRYNEVKVGDMLYYDKMNRYKEIKSVRELRTLYVQEQKLISRHWIQETIDYLENITKQRQEFDILLRYLNELLNQDNT